MNVAESYRHWAQHALADHAASKDGRARLRMLAEHWDACTEREHLDQATTRKHTVRQHRANKARKAAHG